MIGRSCAAATRHARRNWSRGAAEPQSERTITDGTGEAYSIRSVLGDENGMAWRTDHVPARRIVPRKYTADR